MHARLENAPEYVAERVADYIPDNLSGLAPTNGEMRIVLNRNDVVTELYAELYYNNNDRLYVRRAYRQHLDGQSRQQRV